MIEITSYVLGMLTIAAVLLLIALVVGMVKINKSEKKINEHQKQFNIVYENISRNDEQLRLLLQDTHRDINHDINMVEKTIMNQVQQIDQEHHKIEDDIHREIDQTKSYIDSRIDKVVLQGSIAGSKEIIKG